MRAQGGGRIVNVTSLNDVLPAPFGGYYSASKAALASASAVLDAEVRPFGISVTVVAPGFFRTEMAEAIGSFGVAADSPYRVPFAALMAAAPARLETAADPDIVAAAIVDVIAADDAPARVIVGEDAKVMQRLVDDADPEQLATMLRDMVRGLSAGAES
jgi:NAD(P)-dependent dehydrogenase (short-subunit alcohol dehydrogenase family)